jgi:hypothetical protein
MAQGEREGHGEAHHDETEARGERECGGPWRVSLVDRSRAAGVVLMSKKWSRDDNRGSGGGCGSLLKRMGSGRRSHDAERGRRGGGCALTERDAGGWGRS